MHFYLLSGNIFDVVRNPGFGKESIFANIKKKLQNICFSANMNHKIIHCKTQFSHANWQFLILTCHVQLDLLPRHFTLLNYICLHCQLTPSYKLHPALQQAMESSKQKDSLVHEATLPSAPARVLRRQRLANGKKKGNIQVKMLQSTGFPQHKQPTPFTASKMQVIVFLYLVPSTHKQCNVCEHCVSVYIMLQPQSLWQVDLAFVLFLHFRGSTIICGSDKIHTILLTDSQSRKSCPVSHRL